MICWTLGITEHHNAVDNVLALINLALLTGHVGRWGSGLNPLRGQNNVQGGGDMGALPDRLPGLPARRERRGAGEVRAGLGRARAAASAAGTCRRCSRRWSAASCARSTSSARTRCSPRPTSITPQHLLESLDCLIVQDMFLTATAEMADVVLPAAAGVVRVRRHGHHQRAPGAARAQGARRARRGRATTWRSSSTSRARSGTTGASRSAETHLERAARAVARARRHELRAARELDGLQWPCYDEQHPGELFLHSRLWERPVLGPRVRLRPGRARSAGRQARRRVSRSGSPPAAGWTNTTPACRPSAYASPLRRGETPRHLAGGRRAATACARARSSASARGAASVEVPVRIDDGLRPGLTFMTLHFQDDVATNLLTIDATDPKSGTAEFKAAAIRIERLERPWTCIPGEPTEERPPSIGPRTAERWAGGAPRMRRGCRRGGWRASGATCSCPRSTPCRRASAG